MLQSRLQQWEDLAYTDVLVACACGCSSQFFIRFLDSHGVSLWVQVCDINTSTLIAQAIYRFCMWAPVWHPIGRAMPLVKRLQRCPSDS